MLNNMADFYHTPEICSHLGTTDRHHIITAIHCLWTAWKHRPCSKTMKTTRHVTAETKPTFTADLTAINWSSLYHLSTRQGHYDAFPLVTNSLIEEHFPTTTDVRHSNDKTWVTKGCKGGTRPPEELYKKGTQTRRNDCETR